MDATWRRILWEQFGAAIDMLENAIVACPEDLWRGREGRPEAWRMAYHTLFWLDVYLSGSLEGFAPPAPIGMEEWDPASVAAPRPYSKGELLAYLEHGRRKCRALVAELEAERAARRCRFEWGAEYSVAELLVYNMRHVQHHAAQLNLLLRQVTDSAPEWVGRTGKPLTGEP